MAHADSTLPSSAYIPPDKNGDHNGYVRVIDRKGKSFPCGFSRSVQSTKLKVGAKRSRAEISEDSVQCSVRDSVDDSSGANEVTAPEECLHPEEAVFLHTRGLLRIESLREKYHTTIISTQELINKILPECNISLTAYLAYAHLREQGYILMRYTESRLDLLMKMNSLFQSKNEKQTLTSNTQKGSKPSKSIVLQPAVPTDIEELNNDTGIKGDSIDTKIRLNTSHMSGEEYIEVDTNQDNKSFKTKKNIKQAFKDDVANAPPPCISHNSTTLKLSYLAYHPNAQFKRTNPGLPDFGVAIMPYHSSSEKRITFDNLSSLLSLCQSDTGLVYTYNSDGEYDFPLRTMTVSDGGAVVAFGITRGDVPVVSCVKNSKNN